MPPATGPEIEADPTRGVGCRTLVSVLGSMAVFATAAVVVGLLLALADDPSPLAEQVGFGLYAAGAPVSGLFAVITGDLPLAPFTDAFVWIPLAWGATRLIERRRARPWRVVGPIIGAALAYGTVISFLIERA